jgi:hypothetical protein
VAAAGGVRDGHPRRKSVERKQRRPQPPQPKLPSMRQPGDNTDCHLIAAQILIATLLTPRARRIGVGGQERLAVPSPLLLSPPTAPIGGRDLVARCVGLLVGQWAADALAGGASEGDAARGGGPDTGDGAQVACENVQRFGGRRVVACRRTTTTVLVHASWSRQSLVTR